MIEIDLIAVTKDSPYRREEIETDRAPLPPNSRYAQAVKVGPYVFTAGQLATDFVTAPARAATTDPRFPHFGRSIRLQTAYILDNIRAVLEAAGSSLDNVVQALIYLTDSRDFPGLEEVWREYFPVDPPARAVVPATTVMPGCRLEIQVVAVAPDGHVKKETVRTDRAPMPTIHQSQATKAGDLVFLSGLMATDFKSAIAPAAQVNPAFPNHGSSIKRQMEYIFDTADAILQEAGSSLQQLVRRHNYLTDFAGEMPAFREVTRERLKGVPNASTTIEVASEFIIPACTVLIDAMGVVA
jgi:enamine deaminase RidA (YjgF/YER057c/UK114 family)